MGCVRDEEALAGLVPVGTSKGWLTIHPAFLNCRQRRSAEVLSPRWSTVRGIPRNRGECRDGVRPCPFVACKHHLYLDVAPNGSIHFNFPEIMPWEMDDSCALDVAELGGIDTQRVADLIGRVTSERVCQFIQEIFDEIRPSVERMLGPDVTSGSSPAK